MNSHKNIPNRPFCIRCNSLPALTRGYTPEGIRRYATLCGPCAKLIAQPSPDKPKSSTNHYQIIRFDDRAVIKVIRS